MTSRPTSTFADDRQDNPVADPAAVVVSGNARFTILTPGLVRLEWSPDGKFEDRASHVFVNRRLPVTKFIKGDRQGYLTISTDKIDIRYKVGAGRFDKSNLTIRARTGPGDTTWELSPPFENRANLGGTTRTLDEVSGSCPLEPGLLSQNGWTFIDESQRLLFDDVREPRSASQSAEGTEPSSLPPQASSLKSQALSWPWPVPREKKDAIDWYFFVYGHDYKAALGDFIKVAGRIPLPPRFAFGAWWSRYWAYSADELKQLVRQFREHDVPLDVLVIDMDWHLPGWTGYTWDPKCFRDPDGFLKWAHEQGLKVTLNLHPAEGVGKHEKQFPEMCKAMGLDPAKTERIPFDCTDRHFVDAYFNVLIHPLEKQGIDFWWIDWQQGKKTKIDGLDPLWWLNYLHWTDMERRDKKITTEDTESTEKNNKENSVPSVSSVVNSPARRPLLFSRWGGLGNHRYQIGFSGDTISNWKSLAFQPYFTATAGNVGYAYWSHDIGGHQPGKVDPELYVRWIQWGALSPILRTHTTKNPDAERRIWEFPPEYFDAARKAYELRYELIPYIYTAARQCYDTGVPICRPLYLEWPDVDEAYKHDGEYMFGDQLLVAPVTEPADPVSGCAMVEVWLPPGQWTNWFTGRTYEGPKTVPLVVPLDEIPLFVKSGGIIVTQPTMAYSDEKLADKLIVNIFPGDSSETRLYEDDGRSAGYSVGRCAWTRISHSTDGLTRRCRIEKQDCGASGERQPSRLEVRWRDILPVDEVRIGDTVLAKLKDATESQKGWLWDLDSLALRVVLDPRADTFPIALTAVQKEEDRDEKIEVSIRDGARGEIALYRKARRTLDEHNVALPAEVGENLREDPQNPVHPVVQTFVELMGWNGWMRLISDRINDQKVRDNLLIRMSDIWYKLSLQIPADHSMGDISGKTILAECRLVSPQSVPWEGRIRILSDGRFISPSECQRAFHGLSENDPIVLTMKLENKSALETTLVRGEIEITNEGLNFTIPMEKVFLPSINAWWILGPFDGKADGALAKPLPPEKLVDVKATYDARDDQSPDRNEGVTSQSGVPSRSSADRLLTRAAPLGQKIAWRQVKREIKPGDDLTDEFFVNLDDVLGPRASDSIAYAFTYLESPDNLDAVLALGSSDGMAIWLNDKEVFRRDGARTYISKSDHVPVKLRKGRNSLLVKLKQGSSGGGFCVHVEDAQGKPLTKVKPMLEPPARPERD